MEEMKKTSHKGFKIFIIAFLILSMFLLKEKNQNKLISFLDSIIGGEKVLKLVNSFNVSEDMLDISIYDGNIVKWCNNNISFMKTDGTIILEKEFNFTDPSIEFGNKNIYVMDKFTGDVYSLDKKGETIDRLQLNKELFNIKESNDSLIYHTKGLDEESIRVLDRDGILVGNYSYEDKKILTYGSNKNNTISAIALLNLNEGILKSEIETYGENNRILNSLDIEGEILVYLQFVSNEDLIGLTDKALYYIKKGKVMWNKQFDLIKDVYIKEDKIYLLYSNYLEIIDLEGRTESKIGFVEDYKRILPQNRKVLLYGENNLIIIENGREILKHNENINRVFTSDDKILVWTSDKLNLYEVGNKK